MSNGSRLYKTVTTRYAVALYMSSVLGSGVLVPGLTAQIAGPASLLAWIGLSLASYPLAYTFAVSPRGGLSPVGFTLLPVRASESTWLTEWAGCSSYGTSPVHRS